MKFGAQVKPWLSINGAARLFHSNYRSPGYDFEDGGNIPNYTFHAMPFVTPYNPDGSIVMYPADLRNVALSTPPRSRDRPRPTAWQRQ